MCTALNLSHVHMTEGFIFVPRSMISSSLSITKRLYLFAHLGLGA